MDAKKKLGAGVRPSQGGGGIFKSAAVAILRVERRLMTTGEITKFAMEKALINCQGRTPEATMASALYTDIKRKLDSSIFTRPQEGLFGLREWEEEGFIPDPVITAGQSSDQQASGSAVKRMRGPSTRVIKRPERFTVEEFEGSVDDTARSTPSPLLDMEHHSRLMASSKDQLSLLQPSEFFGAGSPDSDVCGPAPCSTALPIDSATPVQDDLSHILGANVAPSATWRPLPEQMLALLPEDESPAKRPCLEVELPAAWEAIPSDLHLLLWTPAAAPLSAALASPGVYGGISPLWPSAGSADRATGSASRGESNEPKLEEMHPSFLDTPNLLQLPLPEGDLSWSPLLATGAGSLTGAYPLPGICSPSIFAAAGEEDWQAGGSNSGRSHAVASAAVDSALQSTDLLAQATSSAQSGDSGNWAGAEARLAAMEAEALRQEALLGEDHPLVGKLWLSLSRAYQSQEPRLFADKAEQALIRAWHICSACFSKCHTRTACDPPFDFLLDRIRGQGLAPQAHLAEPE